MAQVQEAVRDTWIWRWLDAFVFDVRYSIRSLVRSWGFALGTGAVLALGIGASIAIFPVVNTVLLQPLAYPGAERIVSIEAFWTWRLDGVPPASPALPAPRDHSIPGGVNRPSAASQPPSA